MGHRPRDNLRVVRHTFGLGKFLSAYIEGLRGSPPSQMRMTRTNDFVRPIRIQIRFLAENHRRISHSVLPTGTWPSPAQLEQALSYPSSPCHSGSAWLLLQSSCRPATVQLIVPAPQLQAVPCWQGGTYSVGLATREYLRGISRLARSQKRDMQ